MKKVLKIILAIIIFSLSFICVDGLCARYFNTRPIIAKRETIYNEITNIGIVYSSMFADVYYCDTVMEVYNGEGSLNIEKEIKRYYQKKKIVYLLVIHILVNIENLMQKPRISNICQ